MIDFGEELKKFRPSLEIEDAEDDIYNRDLEDMSDILIELVKKAGEESSAAGGEK